jgi:hypothetical protein
MNLLSFGRVAWLKFPDIVEVPAAFIIRAISHHSDGGGKYLWNVRIFLQDCTAHLPRGQSYSPPWEPEVYSRQNCLSLIFRHGTHFMVPSSYFFNELRSFKSTVLKSLLFASVSLLLADAQGSSETCHLATLYRSSGNRLQHDTLHPLQFKRPLGS